MKKTVFLAVILAGLTTPLLADTTNAPAAALPGGGVLGDENARFSYAIGLRLGAQWKPVGFMPDVNLLVRGLQDAQTGGTNILTIQETSEILAQFSKKMQAKQMAIMAEQAAKNKAEGEAFLATNKINPGVITLPDGLQYKVLTAGDGPTPTAADKVKVNYRGTFIDGTEFDSSAKAGHPLDITVTGGVIKGWTEALQLMKVGSKWELYVPAKLAYGERGYQRIPPSSTLIFVVELLAIIPPKAPPVAPPTSSTVQNPQLTSDVIRVPSADELKKGAQPERITQAELEKIQAQLKAQTNSAGH